MATALACMDDLMFLSKIMEAAKALSVPLRSLKTSEKLIAACREGDAVVFLEPGTTPELARIPQHEAIERFWASALPSERADLPALFVEALTDRPTWRLCRGDHPARAAELVQRLLADR